MLVEPEPGQVLGMLPPTAAGVTAGRRLAFPCSRSRGAQNTSKGPKHRHKAFVGPRLLPDVFLNERAHWSHNFPVLEDSLTAFFSMSSASFGCDVHNKRPISGRALSNQAHVDVYVLDFSTPPAGRWFSDALVVTLATSKLAAV